MNFLLEGASATYRNGFRALDIARLRIEPGERVALLGASGAGKTTLLRLLNASLPTAGVIIDGREVARQSASELRALRRRIGTIFQQPPLVPSLTALQNALCGRVPRWSLARTLRQLLWPARAELDRARETLAAVGLAGKEDALAAELSGGQQQRVAIARVLLQEPEAVLADEPFAALDPGLTSALSTLLLDFVARGRTFVAALHDVEIALRSFPRIVGLAQGRVVFDLPAREVQDALVARLYASEQGSSRAGPA